MVNLKKTPSLLSKTWGGREVQLDEESGKVFRVDLRDTQITDAGLEHLKGLTSLKQLDLRDTQITDAGLVHLKGMTILKTCYLYDTKITDSGLAEIKAALPKCTVRK